mmetsp:Transcript_5105/g.13787  ORF Transcript_5105/g.13787 Transcript_5105/m.13787 type:complete len:244 (-) Transcript_5105:1038-1769(-)
MSSKQAGTSNKGVSSFESKSAASVELGLCWHASHAKPLPLLRLSQHCLKIYHIRSSFCHYRQRSIDSKAWYAPPKCRLWHAPSSATAEVLLCCIGHLDEAIKGVTAAAQHQHAARREPGGLGQQHWRPHFACTVDERSCPCVSILVQPLLHQHPSPCIPCLQAGLLLFCQRVKHCLKSLACLHGSVALCNCALAWLRALALLAAAVRLHSAVALLGSAQRLWCALMSSPSDAVCLHSTVALFL